MNESRCSKARDELYVRCCIQISAEELQYLTTMDHHMKESFL